MLQHQLYSVAATFSRGQTQKKPIPTVARLNHCHAIPARTLARSHTLFSFTIHVTLPAPLLPRPPATSAWVTGRIARHALTYSITHAARDAPINRPHHVLNMSCSNCLPDRSSTQCRSTSMHATPRARLCCCFLCLCTLLELPTNQGTAVSASWRLSFAPGSSPVPRSQWQGCQTVAHTAGTTTSSVRAAHARIRLFTAVVLVVKRSVLTWLIAARVPAGAANTTPY